MEATLNDKGATLRPDERTAAHSGSRNGSQDAGHSQHAGHSQDNGSLLADIHELLERVKHVADPEVSRLRARVEDGVRSARLALIGRTEQITRQARDTVKAGDTYVRDRPWQSVGVAALAGLFIGFLVGRR